MTYDHIICDKCFGVVQLYNDMTFRCQKCGEEIALCGSNFDVLMKNEMTGWVFPVKYKTDGERHE